MKNKLRPLGEITNDMEKLLLEMTEAHKMQFGEILGIIYTYLTVHCPNAREKYKVGGYPIFYYGWNNEKK